MDAIILAAGEGTRFFAPDFERRPLPDGIEYPIPKSLYPVRGKEGECLPIIHHLIKSLLEGGIERIFIGTGYMGEKVQNYIEKHFPDGNVNVISHQDGIDYTRGPLYTLAGVLQYMVTNRIMEAKGFDKIVMLVPSDLLIDRRAVYYTCGTPARGMMASRCRIHVLIEDREMRGTGGHEDGKNGATEGSRLDSIIPARFKHLFSKKLLDCILVPMIATHVDILTASVSYIKKGATKFIQVIHDWLEENIPDDHSFTVEVNVMKASALGQAFFWQDLDTLETIKKMNL